MAEINVKANFKQSLASLGFDADDDAFFLTNVPGNLVDPQVQFHIDVAAKFKADAVYLRKQLNGSYKPQVYLYDFAGIGFEENTLTDIQKKVWSSGEVPIVCVFYDTEIKILDCTTHIKDDGKPEYLFESLKQTSKIKHLYDEQFAIKIKSGIFWEEEENKKKFEFKNSSYDKLIDNIRFVISRFQEAHPLLPVLLIKKVIIQSILIKYLEERIDDNGGKLLSEKFFKKYNSSTFNDVLKAGKFIPLIEELNDPVKGFNGNVFEWNEADKTILRGLPLPVLAELLDTNKDLRSGQVPLFPDWRYFEFKFIPVELISRLYEEFLASTGDPELEQDLKKKQEGTFYTPSHLVKLLVDEVLPLKRFNEIDLDNFEILDPTCGSGIFLVIVYKRIVQIWRLQNEMKLPTLNVLKTLLKKVHGIDKEEQAIQLASFSLCLALCNELEPMEIITKLKFDDLRSTNIIHSDFFHKHALSDKKFDLIIGNPPFVRGGTKSYLNDSKIGDEIIEIPSNQLALKVLIDSYVYLKPRGLQCLIIKSSSLLYNSSSIKFKEALFSNLNVLQVLDFTALGRNNSLWDGADVAAAAMFIRRDDIDFRKNILHLTFRRTRATKERIVFEIDDYDLHFVNRQTAIHNDFIWKNNLMGGGRIKTLVSKLTTEKTFKEYLEDNDCIPGEGHGTLLKETSNPTRVTKRLLSSGGIINNKIGYHRIETIAEDVRLKISDAPMYHAPAVIISETLDMDGGNIKIALTSQNLIIKNRYVGIVHKNKDIKVLNSIFQNIIKYNNIYILQLLVKSAQAFININTSILAYDLYNLNYIDEEIELSKFDIKVSNDVVNYMQKFIRNGERSIAVKPIPPAEEVFKSFLINYGSEFCEVLNIIFENQQKKFVLTDVITLPNSFIATVFRYSAEIIEPTFRAGVQEGLDPKIINELSNHKISAQLASNRIIKLYPAEDTIIFIKPNQQRYWLSLIAYRDADKYFADFSKTRT